MHVNLIPQQHPEEKELIEKRIGLVDLAEKLSQNELELETVKADLLVFEERYLRTVGVMYAELDKIEVQILGTVARCYPLDKEAEKKAAEAWDQARESARATEFIEQYKKQKHVIPSDELKKLYREAARTMHPDLTTNEEARVARQAMMVQINLAYEKGDAQRLRLLLRRWLKSPESVEGEGTGAELLRVIRKIAQAEERIRVIDIKIAKSKSTDLWLLKEEVENAEQDGRDVLNEMTNTIKSKIDAAKARLDNLKENFDYV